MLLIRAAQYIEHLLASLAAGSSEIAEVEVDIQCVYTRCTAKNPTPAHAAFARPDTSGSAMAVQEGDDALASDSAASRREFCQVMHRACRAQVATTTSKLFA